MVAAGMGRMRPDIAATASETTRSRPNGARLNGRRRPGRADAGRERVTARTEPGQPRSAVGGAGAPTQEPCPNNGVCDVTALPPPPPRHLSEAAAERAPARGAAVNQAARGVNSFGFRRRRLRGAMAVAMLLQTFITSRGAREAISCVLPLGQVHSSAQLLAKINVVQSRRGRSVRRRLAHSAAVGKGRANIAMMTQSGTRRRRRDHSAASRVRRPTQRR